MLWSFRINCKSKYKGKIRIKLKSRPGDNINKGSSYCLSVYNSPLTDGLLSACALLCSLLMHFFRNFSLSLFFVKTAPFPCYTFLVWNSSHVALFSCCTIGILHAFYVALFRYFTLFIICYYFLVSFFLRTVLFS